jgi:hypothetical protein
MISVHETGQAGALGDLSRFRQELYDCRTRPPARNACSATSMDAARTKHSSSQAGPTPSSPHWRPAAGNGNSAGLHRIIKEDPEYKDNGDHKDGACFGTVCLPKISSALVRCCTRSISTVDLRIDGPTAG